MSRLKAALRILAAGLLMFQFVTGLPAQAAASAKMIAYKPAAGKQPTRLIASDARDCGNITNDNSFYLYVLASESTGLTYKPQPVLYWYATKSVADRFIFNLTPISASDSLVSNRHGVILPLVQKNEIHALRFDMQKISLEKNREYAWSFALDCNSDAKSAKLIASGTIKHTVPLPALADLIDQAGSEELPRLFAEYGYWYDTVAALLKLTEKDSSRGTDWEAVLRNLLEQEKLPDVTRKKRHRMPLYSPAPRGVPTRQLGTIDRGYCERADIGKDFKLFGLVPKHTGRTLKSQPTLYWSVSNAPAGAKLHFILGEANALKSLEFIEPLVETEIDLTGKTGIQALPLNVHLQKQVEYEWSLSLACDPHHPSKDIIAIGTIEYVAPPPGLHAHIRHMAPQALALFYAKNGFWYDAIDTLSTQIQKRPNDEKLREIRAELIAEVISH
ncbi:MAG: DUF928 domain-containing protein [Gammaproteobacteria bacterium]|nr:DUF928 domain-containing protein [Gammaproteobacteria bacterium]